MLVRDIMSRDVVTCPVGATAEETARLMWERDVGAVPVVDDAGAVVGMVTDRDLCMASYIRGLRLSEIPVASVMSRCVKSCPEDAGLGAVGDLMRAFKVRRLPVVDRSGRLVGLVALGDLALHCAQTSLGRFDEVAEVIAGICRRPGSRRRSLVPLSRAEAELSPFV